MPPARPAPLAGRFWHRPLLWGIVSLVFNPLLLVSAVALLFGWLGLRARRRTGAPPNDEWLGLALGLGGLITGLIAHAMLGALGYYGYQRYARTQVERGPITVAGYSYREARAAHRTRLVRHGPTPDAAHATPPPNYVTEVRVPAEPGELIAWLVLPEGEEPVPGVVYLHSGFALAESDASSAYALVTAGYALLLPALRGENGNPGNFELCYGEVDDVKAAVRYLAAHPRVIDDRLYVFGHAIGGSLAALLALDPEPSVRLTGSVGGLFPPGSLFAWEQDGYVPFRVSDARERDLRFPVRFLDQLAVPHHAYIGEADPLHGDLPRLQPALDRSRNLLIEIVPGDTSGSLLPALSRFIRRTADATDFDHERVLADLVAPESSRQQAALAALRGIRLPLTAAQTTQMLRLSLELDRTARPAAAEAEETIAVDPRPAALLDAAARSAAPEDLRRVDLAYPELSPLTRSAALRALLEPNDRDALARALDRLIAERDPRVSFPAAALRPVRAELLFPALLALGVEHPWWEDLLAFVLDRCEDVREVESTVAAAESRLLAYVAGRQEQTAALRRPEPGPWLYAEGYAATRYGLGLSLDALGCFAAPTPARLQLLRDFEGGGDPLLRYYAQRALLALGEAVDDEALAATAKDDQTRAWLYALLAPRSMLWRIPRADCTQEALARSHLVQWLSHPLELGQPPTQIELSAAVRRGEASYFVFRFRARPGAGWEAGVAGPYSLDGVVAAAPDDVFSDYRPAGTASPEAHVERVLSQLAAWRAEDD